MKKVVRMVGLAMAVMAITGVATSCSKKDDKKADASAVEEKIERVRVERCRPKQLTVFTSAQPCLRAMRLKMSHLL